ncbi:hypothetical protein [Kitasatospora aureofaciens]|uniref:hypothetical protein n=1 Tax=Kitasatospora aureofaciens TaxID=1894 RepID=UPI0036F489B0
MTATSGPGVWLHIDEESVDFHITVDPGHRTADLRFALSYAEAWGLALLSQDECEPEVLDNDRIRLYLKSVTHQERE